MTRSRHTVAKLIARRFLRSPRSHSIINVMSWISVVAVGVPVAAMVILMSVFNGFDGIVRTMYSDFEPELTIAPARGKVLTASEALRDSVLGIDEVLSASYVLDGEALLTYGERKCTATVRGVDSLFTQTVAIEDMMSRGEFVLRDVWGDRCVAGLGVAYELGLRQLTTDSVAMYVPSRGRYSKLMPLSGINHQAVMPAGVFSLDADTDGKYVITSLEVARALLDYPDGASALKVRLRNPDSSERAKQKIAEILPDDCVVQTRAELNASMYKVLDYEKMAVLLIGMMILIVASFSVVGTLTMLIIDKKESLATLRALGADTALLRSVFVRQGMAICLLGAVGGFVLGVALSLIQQYAGVIRIPAETFLIDTYPVRVVFADLAIIVVIFTVVSYITTRLTVAGRIKNESIE